MGIAGRKTGRWGGLVPNLANIMERERPQSVSDLCCCKESSVISGSKTKIRRREKLLGSGNLVWYQERRRN